MTVEGDGEVLYDLGCVGGVALDGPDLIIGGGGVLLLPALVPDISPSSCLASLAGGMGLRHSRYGSSSWSSSLATFDISSCCFSAASQKSFSEIFIFRRWWQW